MTYKDLKENEAFSFPGIRADYIKTSKYCYVDGLGELHTVISEDVHVQPAFHAVLIEKRPYERT